MIAITILLTLIAALLTASLLVLWDTNCTTRALLTEIAAWRRKETVIE